MMIMMVLYDIFPRALGYIIIQVHFFGGHIFTVLSTPFFNKIPRSKMAAKSISRRENRLKMNIESWTVKNA